MNTSEITINRTATLNEIRTHKGWLTKQAETFENGRFGLMALFLTLQSCVGSIAAMFILQNDAALWQLATCAGITMGANAIVIAQASGKACVSSIYIANILNILFIVFNL